MSASDGRPLLRISRRRWRRLLAELGRRGGGVRESGAFLLGRRGSRRPRVVQVVYFDDIEREALTGAVRLSHAAFVRLWDLCDARGVRVLGDVHTHPGEYVAQSGIDEDNPLVARPGHVALIVPHLGTRRVDASDVGVYEYRGDDGWYVAPAHLRPRRLRIGWLG
jgi:proteasome lid subunit RPN8/RPN11